MVKVSKVVYKQYGECVELTNGKVVARVTCDFGPRVIYYGNVDEVNMMFEDADDMINKSGEYFDTNYKKGEMWHIYGGHRLWKSPEDLASYYPDNYKVNVQMRQDGAKFIGEKEITTGIAKTIDISMNDAGVITLVHTFTNLSDKPVEYSLWTLSVMDKGGIAYAPMSTEDTGLLANRNLVIWPYTDIKDERIDLRQNALVIRQDPNALTPMKFGYLNTEGKVYYLNKGMLFEVGFPKGKRDGNYADYSSNTELYTSNLMFEVETLSELSKIQPNESVDHVVTWTLHFEGDAIYNEMKDEILK